MKRKIILFFLILMPVAVFSQDMNSLNFINALGDRDRATFGDAVRFFAISRAGRSAGFRADLAVLKKDGIAEGMDYKEDLPLKRGTLAIMISGYMPLEDSLLFTLFGGKRYATRACIAQGVMNYDVSEGDYISGEELIEIMANLTEKTGDK